MVAKAIFVNIVLYIVIPVNHKYNTDFYILLLLQIWYSNTNHIP